MYLTHSGEDLQILVTYVGQRLALLRQWLRSGEAALAPQRQALRQTLRLVEREGMLMPDQLWARRLSLSELELELFWLACGPHLDGELRGILRDEHQQSHMDGALAQRLLGGASVGARAVRQALRPQGPLLRHGLLRLEPTQVRQPNELHHELVPAQHLLWALDGQRASELAPWGGAQALKPEVTLRQVEFDLHSTQEALEALRGFRERPALQEAWFGPAGLQVPLGLGLGISAPRGQGAALCARALAGQLHWPVLEVHAQVLLRAPQPQQWTRRLFQEARAHGELILVRDAELVGAVDSELAPTWAWCLRHEPVAVLLCSTTRPQWHPDLKDGVPIQISPARGMGARQQQLLWQVHMPGECQVEAGALEDLANKISLQPGQIRGASRLLYLAGSQEEGVVRVDREALDQVSRQQLQQPSTPLARVVEHHATLQDLVLPPDTQEEVKALVSAIRSRRQIMEGWGLRAALGRGLGLSALFDGDPGTGKTLAAEAIAGECQMSLMQVDASTIIDKYIGETEKNLTELFSQVRPDLHVLLFDEADSLFGKRTEVRHATDRYANMNINTLLQLIERYEGVTILTTNLKKSIDPAFERRLTFKVNFPKPQAEQRLAIWRRLLRPPLQTGEEVDHQALAEIELTGGEIKNALLKAAYQAAREGRLLDTDALYEAALGEARGAGRLIRAY